jgi:uncharacterized protein (TIGR03435 family)
MAFCGACWSSVTLIRGCPDWIQPERFSVEAKAEDPSTPYPELLAMLQKLLADRFRLRFHRVPMEVSGFVLLVAI